MPNEPQPLHAELVRAYAVQPGDVLVAHGMGRPRAGLVVNVDQEGEDRVKITLLDCVPFELSTGDFDARTVEYDAIETLTKVVPAP